jgi:hypothetical protein
MERTMRRYSSRTGFVNLVSPDFTRVRHGQRRGEHHVWSSQVAPASVARDGSDAHAGNKVNFVNNVFDMSLA